MSVRTKVLVTVATVATMTAIGTTKAYGLENKSVNNIGQVQIVEKQNDDVVDKAKDLNINANVKDKDISKKEIINKSYNEENELKKSKINKEEKKINYEKTVMEKKLKNKDNTDDLNIKESQKDKEKEKTNLKLIKDQAKEKKTTLKEEDVKQNLYKSLENNSDTDKLNFDKLEKENNIVEGKIINSISKVNVRKNASLDSLIIGEISLGENVKVDKSKSNAEWYGICFGEKSGFVSVKYVEINTPQKKHKTIIQVKKADNLPIFSSLEDGTQNNIVNGQVIDILSKLNVRESASLDSIIIGQLDSGANVKVDKNHSNSEWFGICFGEHGGFVSAKYIKLDKNIVDNKNEDKDDNAKKDLPKETTKDDSDKKDKNETSKDKETSNFVLGEVINVASHLNVREKPTTECKSIGKIYAGNEVLVNKDKSVDGWYEIAFGIHGGYVSSDYIKIIKKDYLITDGLVKFVASYEGYGATPYRGADYQNRTIGYGHVIMPGETYNYLTEPEARNLLKSDLNVTATQVKSVLDEKSIKLNIHQFDSLVSFAYNCGVQGLTNSRLLRDIQNKADLAEIKDAFLAWRHCNGIELEGLKRRRIEEFEMYSTGDYIRDLI